MKKLFRLLDGFGAYRYLFRQLVEKDIKLSSSSSALPGHTGGSVRNRRDADRRMKEDDAWTS